MNIAMNKKNYLILFVISFFILNIIACYPDFGKTVIQTPDKYRHVYEAKEKPVLKAIARVFNEKKIGSNVTINYKENYVDSDFVTSGDWRTKAAAYVRKIDWKECEVVLAVTTEKKTENGWEMRRLLEQKQYETFFNVIDIRIYEEMSNID
jgi:hypothetical protein